MKTMAEAVFDSGVVLHAGMAGCGDGVGRPEVSIVIAVFNSVGTIEQLCARLIESLGTAYRLQIVLVDDGSTDGSYGACLRAHEARPDVVECVRLSRNFGEHNAVMAGLNYVEGDYCIVMDDDFQNPPSEVHALLDEAAKGYEVVYVRYDRKMHSGFRNLGSRLHNWMATRALGKPADLYLSSFKLLSRFVVQEIVRYTGPDPYLDGIVLRTTRNVGVVTVRHAPREQGVSGYTFGKLVSLWGNMIVAFSLYPLRLIAAFGLVLSCVGLVYAIYTLAANLFPRGDNPDPLQNLQATIFFFRGLTLLAISIIGEYVGRIYMNLNRDPQFIVREARRRHPRTPPNAPMPASLRPADERRDECLTPP